MNKNKVLARFFVLFVAAVSLIPSAQAGRFRQPIYITNAYFTAGVSEVNGQITPTKLFNVVKAGDPALRGSLVMNLIADKGRHLVQIDLLDKDAKKFKSVELQPVEADSDDYAYTAIALFDGPLPAGGVFFKIFDVMEDGKRRDISTIRLLTIDWQAPVPDLFEQPEQPQQDEPASPASEPMAAPTADQPAAAE